MSITIWHDQVMAVALFLLAGFSILTPTLLDSSGAGQGNFTRQAGYSLLLGLIMVALRPGQKVRALDSIPQPILMTLAFCWLSMAWAINPEIAFRRLILLTVVTWSVFIAVRQLGFRSTIQALRYVLILILVLNFATVALWPSIGIHQFDEHGDLGLAGDWKGVLQEKNLAGAVCAITILVLIFGQNLKRAHWHLILILPAALFLWRSGSKTSMVALAGALCGGGLFSFYRPAFRLEAVLLLLMAACFVFLLELVYWDELSATLWRDGAFTGRSQIWGALLHYLGDNWLLGAGYGSFWNIGPESPIYIYANNQSWISTITSAHNGYLELAVQLGIPGMVLATVALLFVPLSRLLANANMPPQHRAFLVAALIFCSCQNLTEASMLNRDSIIHIFWMVAIALVGIRGEPATDRTVGSSITRAGRGFASTDNKAPRDWF